MIIHQPDANYSLGGTGYQPVPSGYQPDGMIVTPLCMLTSFASNVSSPFRSAGCRPGQAGSLRYQL